MKENRKWKIDHNLAIP